MSIVTRIENINSDIMHFARKTALEICHRANTQKGKITLKSYIVPQFLR